MKAFLFAVSFFVSVLSSGSIAEAKAAKGSTLQCNRFAHYGAGMLDWTFLKPTVETFDFIFGKGVVRDSNGNVHSARYWFTTHEGFKVIDLYNPNGTRFATYQCREIGRW